MLLRVVCQRDRAERPPQGRLDPPLGPRGPASTGLVQRGLIHQTDADLERAGAVVIDLRNEACFLSAEPQIISLL